MNHFTSGSVMAGELVKTRPPLPMSAPRTSPVLIGRLVTKVSRAPVVVCVVLLATEVKFDPDGRSTRNVTALPELPDFRRQRTTVPSTGEAATGVPPEV